MEATKFRLLLIVMTAVAVLVIGVAAVLAFGSDDDGDAVAVAPSPSTAPVTETPLPQDTATSAPAPSATSAPPSVRVEPDGERILSDVRLLAGDIGARPAGTDKEKEAADLIADRLTGLGFDVHLQEFEISTQIGRESSLSIETPESETIATLPIANSGSNTVSARIVDGGVGAPEDFPDATAGAIALVKRDGVIFYQEKVANAVAAGAIGVVLYNNEPGILYGRMEQAASVPVVGISQEDGAALAARLEDGEVTAELTVEALTGATSYNVVAKPPGEECETVTGGHYDSVVQAPGASDNASGTATVLEIASILSQNKAVDSHCFVLFGAEELGLLGSAFYVSELTPEEKGRIKAMVNLDMVGVGDEAWWFIGTEALQQRITALAQDLGIEDAEPGTLIRGLSSDHASFLNEGIPSIMLHRWEDPLLHTPEDVPARVNEQYLEEAARMSIALLQSLSAGG